ERGCALGRSPYAERDRLHVWTVDQGQTEEQVSAVGKMMKQGRGRGAPHRECSAEREVEADDVGNRPVRAPVALGPAQNFHSPPSPSGALWSEPEMAGLARFLAPSSSRARRCEEFVQRALFLPGRIERPVVEVGFEPCVQTPATWVVTEPGEISADVE